MRADEQMSFFVRCKEKEFGSQDNIKQIDIFSMAENCMLMIAVEKIFYSTESINFIVSHKLCQRTSISSMKNIYCRYAFVWNIILYSTIHISVKYQLKYTRLIESLLLDQQHCIIFDCVNKKK